MRETVVVAFNTVVPLLEMRRGQFPANAFEDNRVATG
jgi:hypothetical protein